MNSYFLGISFAIISGLSINIGYFLQKSAVNKIDKKNAMIKQLVKRPVWLAGLFLQFCIGTPLYSIAQRFIGPSLLPGLLSAGMIVLPIVSAIFLKEILRWYEKIGIGLVIVSVSCIGMSRLAITAKDYDIFSSALLTRIIVFNVAYILIMGILYLLHKRGGRFKGVFMVMTSGLLYSTTNLWAGIIMGALGQPGREAMILTITGCVMAAITGLAGLYITQRAFRFGRVSILIPYQNMPVQLSPVIIYFFVFNLKIQTVSSILFMTIGVSLIIIGSFLLAKQKESSMDGKIDTFKTPIGEMVN